MKAFYNTKNNKINQENKYTKNTRGITLIALVITIIVLLILAGVSIAMLSGDNSILGRATSAKESSGIAQIRERIRLAYTGALTRDNGAITEETFIDELTKTFGTNGYEIDGETDSTVWKVTVNRVEENIKKTTNVASNTELTPTPAPLPTGTGTKPYLPSSSFHQLSGTNLSNGLVITDAEDQTDASNPGNEYVWIEVPSTYVDAGTTGGPDYSEVSSETDYGNIATALRNYCSTIITETDGTEANKNYATTTVGYKDIWYDSSGQIASQSSNTSDTTGCGLTNEQYIELYNKMLKSIYKNGGFWIGRYEAGTTEPRANNTAIDELTPLSKVNLYTINFVRCSEAQTIASKVPNKGTYNSSLMFGIQWDLVLRHLSNKGVDTSLLTEDSSTWGNYQAQIFDINRGKYSQISPWNVYIDYTTPTTNKVTVENGVSRKVGTTWDTIILLTTGAADVNKKINIYDLAGNVSEWTLESAHSVPSMRGGSFGGRTGRNYSKSFDTHWVALWTYFY